MATKGNFKKVWGIPVLLAVITTIGLILAIIGTGIWHFLSWIALSYPVYVMCRHGLKFYK